MAPTRTTKTTSTRNRRSSKAKTTDDSPDGAEDAADETKAPDPPWSDAKDSGNGTTNGAKNGTDSHDDDDDSDPSDDPEATTDDTDEADEPDEDTEANDTSDKTDDTDEADDTSDKTDEPDEDTEAKTDDTSDKTDDTDPAGQADAPKQGRFRKRKRTPQAPAEVAETPEQVEERVVAHLDLLAHERRRPATTQVARDTGAVTTTTVAPEPDPQPMEPPVVDEPVYEQAQPTVIAVAPPEPTGWPELKPRRLFAATLIVVIAAGIGFIMGGRVPPTYRAEAEVLYTSDETLSEGQAELRLSTQVALAQSTAIMRPVAATEGLKVAELREQLIVGVAGDSEILLFAVENEDEVAALRILESVVNGYLVVANTPVPTDTTEYLQVRIAELEAERDALATRLAETPEGSRAEVEAELESVQSVLSSMERLLTETELENIGADSASLLSPAQLLPDPVGSPQLMSAAVGALAGIAVAGMILFILRQRDQQGHRSQ